MLPVNPFFIFIFFCCFLPNIFPLKIFYISNSTICQFTSCDGSSSNPFPGLISGFLAGMRSAQTNNDYSLSFELLSKEYSINDKHLSILIGDSLVPVYNETYQLFERNITINKTMSYDFLRFKPADCDNDTSKPCDSKISIKIKTENISFTIATETIFQNLIFLGNDLPFRHQNILNPGIKSIDNSCLNDEISICCSLESLYNNKTSNSCYVLGADDSQREFEKKQDYQYGLFQHKHDKTSLIIQGCEFRYLIGIGANSVDTFSYLIGAFIDPNIKSSSQTDVRKNLVGLSLKVKDSVFLGDYFFFGLIYYTNNNANGTYIEIVNSEFDNYNGFLIKDKVSYYNDFLIIISNATQINFTNSTIINCFKVMYLDYSNKLKIDSIKISFDNGLQIQNVTPIYKNISLFNGDNDNYYEVYNLTITVNLVGPFSDIDSHILFQAKNNNTLILQNQNFSNLTNIAYFKYIYYNRINLTNVHFMNSLVYNIDPIYFDFDNALQMINCSFINFQINKGNYISFKNSSIVTITNFSLRNSFSKDLGSFLKCIVSNCSITMKNTLMNNISSLNSFPLFYFESTCFLTINSSNFSNFTSVSQGGILYGALIVYVSFYDCIFDSINSSEGAIIYIKKNSTFRMDKIITTNCTSTLDAFIYYGRENNNSLYVSNCYFANNNGTAIAQLLQGSLDITNCSFINSTNALQVAVVVYAGSLTPLNFTNCNITNGFVDSKGSTILFLQISSNVLISNCNFLHISGYHATAIYASNSINLEVSSITVNDLNSSNEGAIYLETNNKVTIKNSKFTNINCNTSGGVLYISSQNSLNFTQNFVYDVSVLFFGAFAMAIDNNIVLITSSNISLLNAQSKGGFFYATGSNNITLESLNISFISSETGSFVALNTKNSLWVINCFIFNSTAVRYGGLIYAFTQNIVEINGSNFSVVVSKILAGGFYLDILNNLTMKNSNFLNFTAVESGAIFVTIYENNIYSEDVQFKNIFLMEGNDGVIARFGISTNITIIGNSFQGLFNQLTCYVFMMNANNFLNISNCKFLEVNLSTASGFLQASSNNILLFDYSTLDFRKNISTNQGVLFYFLTSNNLQSMKNSTLLVAFFETLFDFEANCNATIESLTLKDSNQFLNFFMIKNNSNITISSMRLKVTSQQMTISDSFITLKSISIAFNQALFPSKSFIIIYNTKIEILKSYFRVVDNSSQGNFLMAGLQSSLKFIKTTFIGFNSAGNDLAGVINSIDAVSLYMKGCLLMMNQAGSNGGVLSYKTSSGESNGVTGRILLNEGYIQQNIRFSNNIFFENKAVNGLGGAIFISNENYQNIIMSVSVDRTRFSLNKGNSGGGLYVELVWKIQINNSDFSLNNALIKDSINNQSSMTRAEGGAFYFNGISSAYFLNYKNIFYKNKADIGGALYLSPLNLMNLSVMNVFDSNSDKFYGTNFATPIYRISFKPGNESIRTITQNQSITSFSLENLQSGYLYTDCLAEIVGIDMYDNIAYMTNEDFLSQVKITEESNPTTTNMEKSLISGAICFNSFVKTKLPINSTATYKIKYQRYDQKSDELTLKISFRDCQIGEKLTENFQCQTCPDGTYSLVKDFSYINDNCKDCFGLDFSCQTGGLYTPNEGFWRYGNYSSNFVKCPKQQNCLGGDLSLNDSTLLASDYSKIFSQNSQIGDQALSGVGFCKLGYKGILCNECDSDYGKVNAYSCLQCKESGYIAWVIFQILFKVVILFVSWHISLKTSVGLYMEDISEVDIKLTNLIKIMLNHVQMLIVLFTFVDFSQIYNNIISFFLGINTNMGESFNVECLLKQVNWDLSPLYFEFWITVLYFFPVALVCFIYVKLIHKVYEKKYMKTLKFSHLYLSCILIVLQLCYFDIINVTFKLYPCFNVSDDYDPEARLVFDYSIRCEDKHQIIVKYAAGLPIILGFGVGFPLILLMILKSKLKDGTLRTDDSLLTYGYFFFIYEEQFFFWDILQSLRKFSMTLIQILLASSIVVQNFASLEVLLVVVFAFLCLQLKLRPYLKPNFDIVNTLERTSLLALTFSFYFALYHTGLAMVATEDMFGADLALFLLSILINAFFFFYWCYIFLPKQILATWSRLKACGSKAMSLIVKPEKRNGDFIVNHDGTHADIVSNHKIDPISLTVLNFEGNPTYLQPMPSISVIDLTQQSIKEKNGMDGTQQSIKEKNGTKTETSKGDSMKKIDSNAALGEFGSKNSLLDSGRRSSQSEKKSFLFPKSSGKKEPNSFAPIDQFSFPSLPDLDEENNDLGFVGLLNWEHMEKESTKLSFLRYNEEKKNGMLSGYQVECENFNKINFFNKKLKKAMFSDDGVLFVDENCEISFKINKFVQNSNFLRLECLILKKKSDIAIHGLKLTLDAFDSSKIYFYHFSVI